MGGDGKGDPSWNDVQMWQGGFWFVLLWLKRGKDSLQSSSKEGVSMGGGLYWWRSFCF